MKFSELREEVHHYNMLLGEAGLVVLTWGNASALDRQAGVFAIKPSGVPYAKLGPEDIVLIDMESGGVVTDSGLSKAPMRPSSDSPTHWELYKGFEQVGGIVHTHSTWAVAWAQSGREIPVYGSTHADNWAGRVPLVRALEDSEIQDSYELSTGTAILDSFSSRGLDPLALPGAILPHHGPFTWGATIKKAYEHAVALEEIAKMAAFTESINPSAKEIPGPMANKHFSRKHGPNAYYGQEGDKK